MVTLPSIHQIFPRYAFSVFNTTSSPSSIIQKRKIHQCPLCFKRFNRPSSLQIHANTHTGATRIYLYLFYLFIHI